ncbi:hypothetical protein ACOSQ3_006799 [Xanthoceras sorbifolium]
MTNSRGSSSPRVNKKSCKIRGCRDRRSGYKGFKQESDIDKENIKVDKTTVNDGVQVEEIVVPTSLEMVNKETVFGEGISIEVGRVGLGDTDLSERSRDYVMDENANNLLVEENARVVSSGLFLDALVENANSLIFFKLDEFYSIQSSTGGSEEVEEAR